MCQLNKIFLMMQNIICSCKRHWYCIVISIFLIGCRAEISNDNLRDKVLACSASYHQGLHFAICAKVDNHLTNGTLSSEFKDDVYSVFDSLSDFSKQDRIKIYDEYIKCIESIKY